MSAPRFVVAGTDTGVGKTVFCAGLAALLGAFYWKPVQAGLDGETDSQAVARLGGLGPDRILPEAWRLTTPASPHFAAKLDGVVVDPAALEPPQVDGPLIIEAAGGLLVPLDDATLSIDLFARWGLPVILVGRAGLGGISHALLSIEALKRRGVPLHGVAYTGEDKGLATIATVHHFSESRLLGRLPTLDPLTPQTLSVAFGAAFLREHFLP